jgi:hypothetical protein
MNEALFDLPYGYKMSMLSRMPTKPARKVGPLEIKKWIMKTLCDLAGYQWNCKCRIALRVLTHSFQRTGFSLFFEPATFIPLGDETYALTKLKYHLNRKWMACLCVSALSRSDCPIKSQKSFLVYSKLLLETLMRVFYLIAVPLFFWSTVEAIGPHGQSVRKVSSLGKRINPFLFFVFISLNLTSANPAYPLPSRRQIILCHVTPTRPPLLFWAF